MAATRRYGFNLVELMIVIAALGAACGIALETYGIYVIKAQLAQQLLAVGHIRESLYIEARSGTQDDTTLADGSVAGKAPPHLAGPVSDDEFNGPEGLRLQLVYLPSALLAAFPQGGYGLVVDSSMPGGLRHVRLFYQLADRSGFATAWLSDASFIIGLIDVSKIDSGTGGGGTGGGGTGGGTGGGSTGGGGTGGGSTGGGGCPPGWTAHGNSGNCSPPNPGNQCPPGFSPIGNSGQCRAS